MPVTSRFRLKFKRLARKRIKACIRHTNSVLTYDEDHPEMELLDTPTRNCMLSTVTELNAALLLKVLA